MNIFVSEAFANAGTPDPAAGGMFQMIMLGAFVLIFWLMIWRPQSKRAKEHKTLLASLSKGDETVTSGGILGKVVHVTDDYVTLQVSGNIDMNFQKSSVVAVLPKGTIKAIAQTVG